MSALRSAFHVAEKMEEKLGSSEILFRTVPESMNHQTQRAITLLAYSGIVPFLFLSIALLMRFTEQDYNFALRGYSVAIISFLCGIHWATHLFCSDRCRGNLLIKSNIITLVSYVTLFLAPQKLALIIECACFLILLLFDYKLLKQNIIALWYFNLRRNVTTVVVFLLLSAAYFS